MDFRVFRMVFSNNRLSWIWNMFTHLIGCKPPNGGWGCTTIGGWVYVGECWRINFIVFLLLTSCIWWVHRANILYSCLLRSRDVCVFVSNGILKPSWWHHYHHGTLRQRPRMRGWMRQWMNSFGIMLAVARCWLQYSDLLMCARLELQLVIDLVPSLGYP